MPKQRKTIVVLATLDTKGREAAYLSQRVKEAGAQPVVMDLGLRQARGWAGDVSRGRVARAAGQRARGLVDRVGREEAVRVMAQGAGRLLERMAARGTLDGVVALGGSVGSAMALEATAGLPLGVPKVVVTTLPPAAIGQGQAPADLVLVHCPVDLIGLNAITRRTLAQASEAVVGMASVRSRDQAEAPPVIGVTCLGVVTPGVLHLQALLERRGYEVVVFHGVTNVDTVMGQLAASSQVAAEVRVAAMDLLLELLSGRASDRDSQGEHPVVYAPGALDMLIMRPDRASDSRYEGRQQVRHSPNVTLVRTSEDEARQLGRLLARRVGQLGPRGNVVVPLRGFSMHSAPGEQFYDPAADAAFLEALKGELPRRMEPVEVNANINDKKFAGALARALWALMAAAATPQARRPGGPSAARPGPP